MDAARWRAILLFFGFSVYMYMDSLDRVETRKPKRKPHKKFSSEYLFNFVPNQHDGEGRIQSKSRFFELAAIPKENPAIKWRRERNHWRSKIDKHEYRYIINPKRKCVMPDEGDTEKRGSITLLVLVKSSPGNVKLRDAVRSTYMQGIPKTGLSFKVLFLLGEPKRDPEKQRAIEEEAITHGDILQEDFLDSYHNLTIKLIMGFKWASHFCPNAQFVMSVDDDVLIHIPYLLEDLEKVSHLHRRNFVLGKYTPGSLPITSNSSKWWTPNYIYNKTYPDFPLGHGYVISQHICQRIYRASLSNAPLVPWDDVYFGFLLREIWAPRRNMTHRMHKIVNRNSFFMKMRPNQTIPELEFDYLRIELSIEMMYQTWKNWTSIL